MSFWLRAASLPDRPPMAVNLLSIDVIFFGVTEERCDRYNNFGACVRAHDQLGRAAGLCM